MSNEYWVLYDPHQKTQTEKMSTEEAQFSLMKMKTKEINHFLIWKNDWAKWQKLKDFLASDDSPFMSTFMNTADDSSSASSGSSLKMKPADEATVSRVMMSFSNVQLDDQNVRNTPSSQRNVQFDADQLNLKNAVTKSDLNFKNIDKQSTSATPASEALNKIELLLIHPKGSMFRTIAQDISLNGTYSEKKIPEEFEQDVFDMVVINNFINDQEFNRVTLKARVVISNSLTYIEYADINDAQKNSLRAMLEYYIRATKKLNS